VSVPAGWFSGDTHEHIQLCFGTPDVTAAEIYTEMLAEDLGVSNALVWGAGFIPPSQFLSYVDQFVTGAEDPVTAGDPDKVLQFGIETSGVSCANLGHMIGLNIGPAEANIFQLAMGCTPLWPATGFGNDGSGDYSRPVLDLFRQAPGAVTGYAHQSWPVNLYEDQFVGGFDWEDPTLPAYVGSDAKCSFGQDMAFPVPKTCGNTHPVLAPFDVALGRIDFLEAFEMLNSTCGGVMEKRYFGMYYRLLNAGRFVSLSAGTDADCIGLACPPRVYAQIEEGEPLTYANWTESLAQGRVSLASGPYQFLELKVDGRDPGARIDLVDPGAGSASVHVKATYHVNITDASTVSDAIEIVQDGVVVASLPFGPLGTGSVTLNMDLPVDESGWIAARTASYGTHTGAVLMTVDKKPIANCEDAEYWTLYADFLNWNLDVAAAAGQAALQYYVGCSEAEIREYVARGRKVYAALRDYDSPLPVGITRIGKSSPPACAPPAALVTSDVPYVNQPFNLRFFNAPANAPGGLVIATQPMPAGIPIMGAVFHVVLNPSLDPVPITANEGGYGEVFVSQMPSQAGTTVYVQGVWLNPSDCLDTGLLSSSDALGITLQL
jgi:hypothetical protein